MLELTATAEDDPAFIDLVNRILRNAIRCYRPSELFLIHIDSWFDHKWNEYAGRVGYCCNVWLDPLRPPPFAPNRVVSQLVFAKSPAEPFEFDRKKAPALHVYQSSADNSHRRLKTISPSGLFLWYSSGTSSADRGSLMVYAIQDDLNLGWYVSFDKRGDWKIAATTGISRNEIRYFAAES